MKTILLAMAASLILALPVSAQSLNEAVPGVIRNQIEAFKADDFATAFTFASPNIKRMFGNAERFGLMVRQGYPMVWRPADVTFLEQRAEGPLIYQNVLIKDAAGVPHVLEYQMIETSEGWQINGVRFLQPPAVGA